MVFLVTQHHDGARGRRELAHQFPQRARHQQVSAGIFVGRLIGQFRRHRLQWIAGGEGRAPQPVDGEVRGHAPQPESQVLEGFDASGAPKLRPAKRPITLRHLLTHTAGFTYSIWSEPMAQYEKAIQVAFREVADALAVRATVRDRVVAQQRLVAAASDTQRLTQARYDRGVDSYLNQLDAERTLYAARQSLLAAQLAEALNRVELYKTLGGGTK